MEPARKDDLTKLERTENCINHPAENLAVTSVNFFINKVTMENLMWVIQGGQIREEATGPEVTLEGREVDEAALGVGGINSWHGRYCFLKDNGQIPHF